MDPLIPNAGEPSADVNVGIIYTHERAFMGPLLKSLPDAAQGVRMRLILVDNASGGGADEWTTGWNPITVIENDRPLGYAANLNRILQVASAPYVLLMNTDMRFPPAEPCLARMLQFMEDHPHCGLSTCRIHRPDGEYASPARRFQTLRAIAARRLGLPWLFSRSLDAYLYRQNRPEDAYPCDFVSGCFLFLRREAAAAVGGLDEGFRKYFEDADLALRLWRAGWEVWHFGGASCIHHEQRSSKKLFSRDAVRHVASYARWIKKWGFWPRK